MRLARLAMGVPRPPISTPSTSSRPASVKPERSRAAGTLLITWLARRETPYSRPRISLLKASLTPGIRARFPEKRKKAAKVRSRKKSAFPSSLRSAKSRLRSTPPSMKGQGRMRSTVSRQRRKSPAWSQTCFPTSPDACSGPRSRAAPGSSRQAAAQRTREAHQRGKVIPRNCPMEKPYRE